MQDVVVRMHGDSFCPVPPTESGSRGTAVVFPVKQALYASAQPAFFQTLEKRSTGQKTRGKETRGCVEEELTDGVRDCQNVCSRCLRESDQDLFGLVDCVNVLKRVEGQSIPGTV